MGRLHERACPFGLEGAAGRMRATFEVVLDALPALGTVAPHPHRRGAGRAGAATWASSCGSSTCSRCWCGRCGSSASCWVSCPTRSRARIACRGSFAGVHRTRAGPGGGPRPVGRPASGHGRSGFGYEPGRTCCAASTSTSMPGPPWRSWVPPGGGSRHCWSSWRASSSPDSGPSPQRRPTRRPSSRRRSSSPTPSAKHVPRLAGDDMLNPALDWQGHAVPSGRLHGVATVVGERGGACRAASASASPSPAPWCAGPVCCSTTPPPRSTPPPRPASSPPSGRARRHHHAGGRQPAGHHRPGRRGAVPRGRSGGRPRPPRRAARLQPGYARMVQAYELDRAAARPRHEEPASTTDAASSRRRRPRRSTTPDDGDGTPGARP